MSLAERVKSKRLELGLSQAEAAEIAGIRQQSWGSIEDGKTVKPRNIVGIAKALKCDPTWLMTGGTFRKLSDAGTRKIPIISYIQAGALAEKEQILTDDGEFEFILTDMDWSDDTFALKIDGDSMEPEFKKGDIVVIDPEVEPMPGEFVVAKNGNQEATFKKYRPTGVSEDGAPEFELIPLNPDYAIIKSQGRSLKIIGTMVEHRIYRRKR